MSGKASKYRYRMSIQKASLTRSAVGQQKESWSDSFSFWGGLERAYRGEEMLGGTRESKTLKVASVGYHYVTLRSRSDKTISTMDRVRHGTRIMDIMSIDRSSAEEIKLLCREIQP